ncbi:MAG: M48 family metallopeptidase [Sphingomonadales bacterium]
MKNKGLKNILFKSLGRENPISQSISVNLKILGPTSIDVLRSKRKSLAIHIKDGMIEARSPLGLDEEQIVNFLIRKSDWIYRKLKAQNNFTTFQPKKFETGEKLIILGEQYELIVEEVGHKDVELKGGKLHLYLGNRKPIREPEIRAGRLLKAWIIKYAEEHFIKRVDIFSALVGKEVTSIKVRNFKSQWGSCSVHGELKFNWRLIMAPPMVLDYVVVHEIAHIKHHNHSPKYWAHVEAIMPNYRDHKNWLKEFGRTLRWY